MPRARATAPPASRLHLYRLLAEVRDRAEEGLCRRVVLLLLHVPNPHVCRHRRRHRRVEARHVCDHVAERERRRRRIGIIPVVSRCHRQRGATVSARYTDRYTDRYMGRYMGPLHGVRGATVSARTLCVDSLWQTRISCDGGTA